MKTPYTLRFRENYIKEEILTADHLPEQCRFPLEFTQKNIFYQNKPSSILRQLFNYRPFFIDLVEVNSDDPFEFMFKIHGKQVFLFFMLVGDMEFYDSSHRLIAHTLENNFLMSFYDSGLYNVRVDKGKHIALVITIHPDWLEKVSTEYKNIYRILEEFNKDTNPYQAMYQGKIDRNLHKWLRKVYSSQKQDIGVFDGFLRMHMALMLKHYDRLLDSHWLAFDIREFILENLTDENLGIEMLCDNFGLTKRALRYQFMQTFGENILTYCKNRRMELADQLIRANNLTISEVYMRIGYKDESTFRYHFNRYKP
ncbi:AraC family transcriptional regulator [Paenimyroides tangerinum]|uniref:AraC family transcriptional regulator n=1 Tax=Paenimyroides tangerinum TaxID=2488728 RepID=A0A3P3WC30_9FLAO|nr:AraC family transcriptional regulator [Paenimyroides tangerinum]RRJ92741.1 AraC family transcriptional regulator [Paenimyroides tangerinum]